MICTWVLLALGCFTVKRWFWFWFIFSGANMCQPSCIWYLLLWLPHICADGGSCEKVTLSHTFSTLIYLSVCFFLSAPLLPCMEKLLISLVPFRLLLTPIPPLPSVRPGLFLPVLPQSQCAGTWYLCGTFCLSVSHTMEVVGLNLGWIRALTSAGVLGFYILFFENLTSICLFLWGRHWRVL